MSEAGRSVLPEDLTRPGIASQSRNGLVTRLAHNDEFSNAVHCGLGDPPGAEGVPAERINIHSGPSWTSLRELSF